VLDLGLVVNTTLHPLYPWEKDPLPLVKEAGSALGPVWMVAEKSRPH